MTGYIVTETLFFLALLAASVAVPGFFWWILRPGKNDDTRKAKLT